jgi:hypothetical protein
LSAEHDLMATRAMAISKEISLALQPRYPPELQGAVLADLLSIWLAGHAPIVREEILQLHIAHVRELIEINEKLILGEQGHPQTNMGN